MHWKQLMTKVTIGAWDLYKTEGGKRVPVDRTGVIVKVESKAWRAGPGKAPERKVTITLASSKGTVWPKVFLSNSTNCMTLESMYGADTDGWVGKQITLYADKTRDPKKRGSVMVDCVRVRNTVPPGESEELEPQEPDVDMMAAQEAAFGTEDT